MSVNLGFQANDGHLTYFDVPISKDMNHATPVAEYLSNATNGGNKVTVPPSFKATSVQLTEPSADLPKGTITISWHGGSKVLDKNNTSAQLGSAMSIADITVWIPK